jgi:hypothetical protein
MRAVISFPLFILFVPAILAQQVPDTNFTFKIENPAYEMGKGPVINVDNFHYNFHNIDERYKPFAKLLEADGYRLSSFSELFTKEALEKCRILVISNALDSSNLQT